MTIFQQLLQIILRQRQPQDIDHDQSAAMFYVVLTAGLSYVTSAQSGIFSHPLLISLVQTAVQAGILFLILRMSGFALRFVQTCTALFGITAILSVAVWLLGMVPALSITVGVLLAWSFYLNILIMRDALDASFPKAILLAVALGILSVFITMMIVPSYLSDAQQYLQSSVNTNVATG